MCTSHKLNSLSILLSMHIVTDWRQGRLDNNISIFLLYFTTFGKNIWLENFCQYSISPEQEDLQISNRKSDVVIWIVEDPAGEMIS